MKFPYGFPTDFSRPLKGTNGQLWPRCTNSEPGHYNHECGEPAAYIGTSENGFQSCFCAACKMTGAESRGKTFVRIEAVPPRGDLEQPVFSLTREPSQ